MRARFDELGTGARLQQAGEVAPVAHPRHARSLPAPLRAVGEERHPRRVADEADAVPRGRDVSVGHRLHRLAMPVLVVAGADDLKRVDDYFEVTCDPTGYLQLGVNGDGDTHGALDLTPADTSSSC